MAFTVHDTRGAFAGWLLCVACACASEHAPLPLSRCDALIGTDPVVDAPSAFSIVVLPDTQFYAERYPDTFFSQMSWIAQQKDPRKIAFMLHEGDIVNRNVAEQWDVASEALHSLDDVLPYVLTAGNHDLLGVVTGLTREADLFNESFPVAMHDEHGWFCGTYEDDDLQNSYALIEGGGRTWLVIALEFGPRDEVLEWANGILNDFARFPALIVTHAYMYLDTDRYDHVGHPTQEFSPHDYGIEGSVNDGEEMWNALVAPNPNVQIVFSGHMLWPGVGRLTSQRADGSVTHQVLANYQACATAEPCTNPDTGATIAGGDGYLRMVDFNADHSTASITSYSTTLERYLTDPDHEFALPLSLP